MVPRFVLVSVVVLGFIGYDDACSTGWSSFGSTCYKAMVDREDWTGAKVMCNSIGAKLAEVHSADVNKFVVGLAAIDNKTAGFWIGMTDVENEGIWKWTSSQDVLTADAYASWAANEPDNGMHDQNCVFLKPSDNGNWYDGKCHNVKDYICQKDDSGSGGIVG